jgi:hypothetical protein
MRILYIKRAYNTRLHTQVHALSEKGHSIILLLEAPIEYGYSGPGQWKTGDLYSRFAVYYSLPSTVRMNHQTMIEKFALRAMNRVLPSTWVRLSWVWRKWFFHRSLDSVLSKHAFDIIISGNDAVEREDYRTKLVIERLAGKIPIVYDCQDFLTDCFDWDTEAKVLERFVNEKADGVVHTNPVGFDWIASKYRIKRGLVFPNYGSQKYFSHKQPKLSGRDGQLHLVYCGGVQQTPKQYRFPFARDMLSMFREIANLGFPVHLHLGLYPGTPLYQYYMALKGYPGIVMHPYLPYEDMMQALTHYDISLFPIDLGPLQKDVERLGAKILEDSPFSRLDTSKQYEYTLAGLPVLTAPVTWISRWLKENRFGTCFNSIPHLGEILRGSEVKELVQSVRRNAHKFSIENKIEDLESFLSQVIEDRRNS